MKTMYRTCGAFFVSSLGRRLQKQIKESFTNDNFETLPVIFIGSASPFLAVFEQNNPDIVWENEFLTENDILSSFPSFQGIGTIFIVVSNNSVSENMPLLIKEASRLLKSQGRLFILIKNKRYIDLLNIKDMPETDAFSLSAQLREAGFSLQKKKGLLHIPFNFKPFETADNFLSSHFSDGGCFSLLAFWKNPTIKTTNESYNSARITKASVLTSPRT